MAFPLFRLLQLRESRSSCPRIARVTSWEELGTMSKNNLRRITLVREPIWGIHSLTLIISCTWLITSELANQRSRKVLFTCVVYTPKGGKLAFQAFNFYCFKPFYAFLNDFEIFDSVNFFPLYLVSRISLKQELSVIFNFTVLHSISLYCPRMQKFLLVYQGP